MLDYVLQYGLFLAEGTTVVIAIGVGIGFLFNAIRHARESEHLEVKNLNRRFEQMEDIFSTPMSAWPTAADNSCNSGRRPSMI